jgi:hypothetical protein
VVQTTAPGRELWDALPGMPQQGRRTHPDLSVASSASQSSSTPTESLMPQQAYAVSLRETVNLERHKCPREEGFIS